MKNLWITRPVPAAFETLKEIEAKGFFGVVDPLMQVHFHTPPYPPTLFSGVILTSQNAVPALEKFKEHVQELPIYVVGSTTAHKVCKILPKANIFNAQGSVSDLVKLILKNPPRSKAPMLYLRGLDITTPLNGVLSNIDIEEVVVYETKKREPTTVDFGSIHGILVYSSRNAEFLNLYVQQNGFHDKLKNIDVFCISQKVANIVQSFNWGRIYAALSPDEDGIINCIKDAYGNQEPRITPQD